MVLLSKTHLSVLVAALSLFCLVIPRYGKSFVSYGKLKQKSLSPRKPIKSYFFSEIETLGKFFFSSSLGELIFC